MSVAAVQSPIEREYRTLIADNRRWQRLSPRPGDIVVCTPPKCGTTWMQTIVATLLFQNGSMPGPVTEIAPWIEARFDPIDDVVARLDGQTYRRSMKTHTPADGIPWWPSSSYIVVGRDGRDAFMSFLNHMRSMRPDLLIQLAMSASEDGIDLGSTGPPPLDDVHMFFEWWLNDNQLWFEHVASFWKHRGEPNVLFVHYNDMQADLEAQMRRVAAFLAIDVDEALWPTLVERCTFASMKQRSSEIGDFAAYFVGGADAFLYKGSNGRWRDVLSAEELAAFDKLTHELLEPAAAQWVATGDAGLTDQ
jgi:aryl sulfotransferase